MFRFWIQLDPLLILLVVIGIFALSGAIIHWLQFYSGWRKRLVNGALGLPTFVSISTLFALFAAFLLADTMERHMTAQQAVDKEASALLGLVIGSNSMPKGGEEIRAAIHDYAGLVMTDEWSAMREERASPAAAQALLVLMTRVSEVPLRDGASGAVHGNMLMLAQQVVDGRASRLAIVTTHFQRFFCSAFSRSLRSVWASWRRPRQTALSSCFSASLLWWRSGLSPFRTIRSGVRREYRLRRCSPCWNCRAVECQPSSAS